MFGRPSRSITPLVNRMSSDLDPDKSSWWPHIDAAVLLIAVVGFLAVLFVFQPGYMSHDSLTQLRQARSGVFSDAHPPILAFIWSLVDKAVRGPFGMLVLQNLMFWSGAALFAASLQTKRAVQVAVVGLIGFFPPVFGQLGTVWKDVWFLGAMMMAIGLVANAHRVRSRHLMLGGSVLFFLLATGMRHNAVAAVFGIAMWVVHQFGVRASDRRWKETLQVVGGAAAITVLVYIASATISGVLTDHRSHFWQALAIYDVAGVSVNTNQNMFPPDSGVLRDTTRLEDIDTVYTSRSLLPLYREICDGDNVCRASVFIRTEDDRELDALGDLWLTTVTSQPGAYLEHRWDVFRHVLGLTPDPVWVPIYSLKIRENDLGLQFQESPLNDLVTDVVLKLSETPLYRIWVYGIALTAALGLGLWNWQRSRDIAVVAIASSGWLYLVGYFFVAPSPDFRYNVWGIEALLLVGTLALVTFINRSHTTFPSESPGNIPESTSPNPDRPESPTHGEAGRSLDSQPDDKGDAAQRSAEHGQD